ncbi:hypothetical protein [Natronospora cellulosivora (SeqCode)]
MDSEIYNRLHIKGGREIRKLGMSILVISLLLLIGSAMYYVLSELLSETTIPIVVRLGITGTILGVLVLFISLIKEKMDDIKN